MRQLYCWRCDLELPMLEEHEWALVEPELNNAIKLLQRYREEHQCSLKEALENGYGERALSVYFQLTGFKETNADALWHHRVSLYGPPCSTCGKPLRTPRARFCAACGARPESSGLAA